VWVNRETGVSRQTGATMSAAAWRRPHFAAEGNVAMANKRHQLGIEEAAMLSR
jgi:hypothetical protein